MRLAAAGRLFTIVPFYARPRSDAIAGIAADRKARYNKQGFWLRLGVDQQDHMVLNPVAIPERRKFLRSEAPTRFAINLLQPHRSLAADSVNFSEGGLCLRLQETLEVRSLIRLQLTPARSGDQSDRAGEALRTAKGPRPVKCTGRVAWVIQRLDLRTAPPYLFDVGIELVDPPPMLRPLLAQAVGRLSVLKGRSARTKTLESAVIRKRCFVPRLASEPNHPLHWHLIVSVDTVPCFSGHYPSERAATAAWEKFKRQQARR